MKHNITTQRELRAEFWARHPNMALHARGLGVLTKGRNAQTRNTRMAFCEFVDSMHKDGLIGDRLASRATL